jgi:hypothetical protein
MQLPEDDEDYLREKAYDWQLLPDGNGAYLIIRNYPVSAELFDRDKIDLMIRIPAGYNNAALDMFYVDPELKLRKTGAHPEAASHFEDHCERRWQRFSRHLRDGTWRAGIDGLPTFLALIHRELQAKG